jgi:exonuclease SbcC
MLSWLFKKRGGVPAAGTGAAIPVPAQPKAEARAEAKAKQAEDGRAEWAARLQSGQGNDEALLLVARSATLVDIRCAAVEALGTEEALKRAERELRGHDSRVHRAARQRLAAAVAQREARARACELIATATALADDSTPPANRLVALDRDWQALVASLLAHGQLAEFAGLRERINASLHAQGEWQQRLHRWSADARQAVAGLQRNLADVDVSADEDMARRCEAASALRQSRPDAPATAALDLALQAALEAVANAVANAAAAAAKSAQQAVARAEAAQGAALAVADAGHASAAALVATPSAPIGVNTPSPEQVQQLDTLLAQAEAALADGQFGALQHLLHDLDAVLQGLNAAMLDDSLRTRRQALHAEHARLRDWQRWSGAQAIDALVAEAAALAVATLAAADPEAVNAPKLHLKTHVASIQVLRQRWQAMGRMGAPANTSMWQRFDAALQTAYAPVALQQAALKAARHENLRAREALLDGLDALPSPPTGSHDDDSVARWKELLHGLGDFQLAWRQLGPVEHTVPARAKVVLLERQHSSVARIEAPLQEARRLAGIEREQLIVRAETLAQELVRNPAVRDATQRVRELQADWQQHARMLPLTRAVEGALWARFKAATDAVFAQREAAFNARDVELAANLAAREALLERLSSLSADSGEAEVQRTLADVDRAWRDPMELPGVAAGAIDARFRGARAAAMHTLAEASRRRWESQCDTLLIRLVLCEQRETAAAAAASSSAAEGDLASRWAAHDALPPAWQKALEPRWSQAAAVGPLSEAAMGDVLLQLEAALDLPATSEQQAARRDLKLRALKATLEGRGAPALEPAAQRAQWLAAALRQGLPTAEQGERLRALIAVLRQSPQA